MSLAEAASPSNRSDRAYAALRDAILENALTPGTKLPEDAIGAHFGASRTLIRAALARLASEGLVELGKAKSATVASPSPSEAREVFTVRRALEREVAMLLAGSWTTATEHRLNAHVEAERVAAGDENRKLSVRLGAEFHTIMAEETGNAVLSRYVSEIVSRSTLILAVYGQSHPQEAGLAEHRQMIDAMKNGEGAAAAAIVDSHIAAVEDRALRQTEEEPGADLSQILSRYAAAAS
jgi:DNA-binding GntR family transcriptional regulator